MSPTYIIIFGNSNQMQKKINICALGRLGCGEVSIFDFVSLCSATFRSRLAKLRNVPTWLQPFLGHSTRLQLVSKWGKPKSFSCCLMGNDELPAKPIDYQSETKFCLLKLKFDIITTSAGVGDYVSFQLSTFIASVDCYRKVRCAREHETSKLRQIFR